MITTNTTIPMSRRLVVGFTPQFLSNPDPIVPADARARRFDEPHGD